MRRWLKIWTDWFLIWVVVFSTAAYLWPGLFTPLRSYIVPGLGVIMFGMGMTLLPEDFLRVGRMKRAVACGLAGQFAIMPLLAFTLGKLGRLDNDLAMGFIILGACPGGTASNVIAFLAGADVALSVTMTACSTLAAIALTPLIIQFLGGQYLPVDAWAMFLDVVKIVLVPVVAGLSVRTALRDRARTVLEVFPAVSVLFIVLIIATIVALSKDRLAEAAGIVGLLVVVHNGFGVALGYGLARAFQLPVPARRTVAIEVGMQNSGLGVALATTHFTSPLVALPSSLFSIVHNVSGSALANIWGQSRRTASRDRPTGDDSSNEP